MERCLAALLIWRLVKGSDLRYLAFLFVLKSNGPALCQTGASAGPAERAVFASCFSCAL